MSLIFLGLLLIAAGLLVLFMPRKEQEDREPTALEGTKTDADVK
jgi:hypothetical protein